MTIGEGVAFGGLAVGFGTLAIGFVTFLYKVINEETGKRARIFTRIEEIKKAAEEKHQTKEICDIHTDSISKTLNEIKDDVKTLLKNNGH